MSRSYDKIFLFLTLILLGGGILILASASMGLSIARYSHPYYYILHQFFLGVIPGAVLMTITMRIPYQRWRSFALPMLLGAMLLSTLVFVPHIGFSHGGARRWISLGSLSFQPSELLKFAFIVYLAAWLETKLQDIRSFTFGLLPFLVMSGFIASFLVLQPDIGTLGVLLLSALALFFLSGGSLRHISIMITLGLIVLIALSIISPYRWGRLTVFINPEFDPQGIGYQIQQALIAIGSGGVWGRGFAYSQQKFSYLPEPMGDSIFAIFAEELGFIGSLALIALYMVLFFRGIMVTREAPDLFGRLLGAGILFLVIIQAFINISAISGLMPLTGIPLFFVSYGGTALAIGMAEMGIILNISRTRQ